MKYSLAPIALLAVSVAAQSTGQLPSCALTCATAAIGQSGCTNPTDVGCLCRSQAYLTSYASCVASSCSSADQQTATTIGLALCASAGVTITATPSITSSASNSAGSSSAASSASSAASSISSAIRNNSTISSNATAMSTMTSANMTSSRLSSMTGAASSSAMSASSRASSVASSASAAASSAASSASSRAAAPTQAAAWEAFGVGAVALIAGAAALL